MAKGAPCRGAGGEGEDGQDEDGEHDQRGRCLSGLKKTGRQRADEERLIYNL